MDNYMSEKRGTIILGNKVMVSDPCYGLNTWCQGVLKNVLPGEYECAVGFSNEGDWGTRVADIYVTHSDYTGKFLSYEAEEFEVGVDSGQAGIYDYEYYKKYHSDAKDREHVNRRWYDIVCSKTNENIINPDYVSFLDLPEYKATLMAFMQELNELKRKYPNLDVNSVYEGLVNHYYNMVSDDFNLSLSVGELTAILEELNEVLNTKNVDKMKEITEDEKGKNESINIRCKYSSILRDLLRKHERSKCGQKKIYRNTGNTIDGLGFVSSSGFGDGGYTCLTAKDNGKVVSIRIEYITDEDYEEDGEEY